jgi:hypothetical protein
MTVGSIDLFPRGNARSINHALLAMSKFNYEAVLPKFVMFRVDFEVLRRKKALNATPERITAG